MSFGIALQLAFFGLSCTLSAHKKFFMTSMEEWFNFKCNSGGLQSKVWTDVLWAMIFVSAIWVLWKSNNQFVYNTFILLIHCVRILHGATIFLLICL